MSSKIESVTITPSADLSAPAEVTMYGEKSRRRLAIGDTITADDGRIVILRARLAIPIASSVKL